MEVNMANPQAEPSMDEILASIRRIIADDDTPTQDSAAPVEQAPEAQNEAPDNVTETASEFVTETVENNTDSTEPIDDEPVAEEPANEAVAALDALTDNGSLEEQGDSVAPSAPVNESVSGLDDFSEDGPKHTPEPTPVDNEQTMAESVEPMVEDSVAEMAVYEVDEKQAQSPEVDEASLVTAKSATLAASAFGALEENIRISQGEGATLESLVEKMLEPMLAKWLEDNLPRIVEEKVEEEVRRISRRR
ncbi:MAG: DUF2497 domain-containing protein [bacterium]